MKLLITALLAVLLPLASAPAWATDVGPSHRVKRSVVVRAEPDTHAAPIGRLAPGETVALEESLPGWYRVRLADGRVGYVSKAWTVVSDAAAVPLSAMIGETKVHVIDVGTGLAVFVEGPGFTMLYDAGSQDDLASGASNRVVAYIHAARPDLTTIDHLVLSHPHKDHLELMPDVFAAFKVREVWDSGAVNRTVGYCRFLKAVAAEPGVRYHDAIASGGVREVAFTNGGCSGTVRIAESEMMTDQPVPLGPGSSMSILWRDSSHHSDPNENTLVVRLDASGRRVLLAGDAEAGGRQAPATPPSPTSIEAGLLRCCALALRADVLVVGHHGSMTSSRRVFLDAVGAGVFVVSSGPHPYSGVLLPDGAVIDELASRGRVFRTDTDDEKCGLAERKVGPDADESPGGCSSVLVRLTPLAVSAGPSAVAD
jgi:competence protein ComEC